jgi:hypothetical protein
MSDLNSRLALVASETTSLNSSECRAGLEAVSRVLVVASDHAHSTDPDDLQQILSTAGVLPTLLAEPAEFRSRFRPTLMRLVRQHPEFAPVLSEFDSQTWPRRRKTAPPEAELWIDDGVAD